MIAWRWIVAANLLAGWPSSLAGQVQDMEPLDVARVFAARYPETPSVSYIPGLAWDGALRLADLTGEARWRDQARQQMRPFLAGDEPAVAEPYRLTNLAGLLAFADLGDPAASALAREGADLMIPADDSEVIRFATEWTDDMFMATSLLSRVAASGDDSYATAVGRLLTTYVERLQRPDGLFVHSAGGPFAWGRGNGFAALGMAEALERMPNDWSYRPRVLESFRREMRALASYQTDDGSWREVVDEPAAYNELTVTALSVAAMSRGIRLGWLDGDEFGPVVDRGWSAVLARIGADGTVRDVCASTPAGTTLEFYLERPAVNGSDDRAGALVLLAALELEELRGSR